MLMAFRFPALLLLAAVACFGGAPGGPEPGEQTRVRIENRSSLNMDIYVRRNDGRVTRLGFAPGGETTTFPLPASMTAGAAWVRFEARPVRASGEPVVSEPFPVSMGDELEWSVPPQ